MEKGTRSLYILMVLPLLLSLLLVLLALDIIRYDAREFQAAQSYAMSLVDYNLQLARELGVPDNDYRVMLARRRLESMIENATTRSEIYQVILTEMGRFERQIRDQADYHLTKWLERVLADDPNLKTKAASADTVPELEIIFSFFDQVEIENSHHLAEETVATILNYQVPSALRLQTVVFVVEFDNGHFTARVKEPKMEYDHIAYLEAQYALLEQEVHNLRALAGLAELKGPGLLIRLQDAERELIVSNREIVHDVDVQEVVHTLYAGGAQGIAVGGRRLVATSSIRCVGGPIYVNNEPINPYPVVIAAVGDPEALRAAVLPLLDYYRADRQLRVTVEVSEEIRLPAYRRR